MKKLIDYRLLIFLILLMTKTVKAQDWANLNRFKSENKALSALKNEENRVVFMGNSITEGWLKLCPEFFEGKPYTNRGISGQTTPQMLVRFRADVIELKPKVVVILAGTNDIAGNTGPTTLNEILGNIISMVELAKANNIKPILCSVLPAINYSWKPGIQPAEKIVVLNSMIQNYANSHKINYANYFVALADEHNGLPLIYSEDGVHPNKKGYLVMNPIITKAIEETIKK